MNLNLKGPLLVHVQAYITVIFFSPHSFIVILLHTSQSQVCPDPGNFKYLVSYPGHLYFIRE
jgi:hypothetical protein